MRGLHNLRIRKIHYIAKLLPRLTQQCRDIRHLALTLQGELQTAQATALQAHFLRVWQRSAYMQLTQSKRKVVAQSISKCDATAQRICLIARHHFTLCDVMLCG